MGPEVSGRPWTAVPYRKSEPIRILVSGTDFPYGFFGPVRGTDFRYQYKFRTEKRTTYRENKILYQKSVQRTVPIRTDGTAVHGPDFVKSLDFLCPDFCLILDFSLNLV